MANDVDMNRVVRQHLETEAFFSGFFVKGKAADEPQEQPPIAQEVVMDAMEPQAQTQSETPKTAEDLEAIAAEVRQCRKCQLGSQRTNAVPGEGHPKAKIMFVGEAPGADEDAQGRPFVGRAGQLLDKIIAACGLKREDVFIGNILKCRPPGNRDPKLEEIVSCMPYLQRQLESIDPDIIIALGAHAARTLLDTDQAIGRLRGQVHQCQILGLGHKPIKLMATYHPAYLLRSYTPENRRKVWEDMKKALAEVGLPVPQ